MAKYKIYAVVETKILIGEIEAEDEEEAILRGEELERYQEVESQVMWENSDLDIPQTISIDIEKED